ncbi:MAG: DUF86 domain-containing protein [Euryarchaeota archaeon]|nr:DUF86 domain-containing protein [Euryarchaeota archaeon]MDE1837390.1 DUF86 domain-containing protein [Euryarchaeota archaeon]MDE1881941.1 DUF86 domain-containing protein [Euryarchaeota archaeon]MDE2045510.1 DUF86 domain-containing protein [Thermoplasmata archaeon]
MSEKVDRDLISDILDRIERIESVTRGVDLAAFERDWKLQDIVMRNLEVMGEAAGRVSDRTQRRHPEVPWRPMRAARNVLIHQYGKVDLRAVWNAVELLPSIKKALRVVKLG